MMPTHSPDSALVAWPVVRSRTEPNFAEEPSFAEALHEWMGRAPWLAISLALHFVALLVLASIPWGSFEEPPIVCICSALEVPEEVFEEPPPPPEVDEDVDTDADAPLPVPDSADIAELPLEDAAGDELAEPLGEVGALLDSSFVDSALRAPIGVGGGSLGGGKYGGRFGGGHGRGGGRGGSPVALAAGLEWLRAHQDPDGRWDCDAFMKHDALGDRCTGAGDPNHDVGVTALALLAFLGDGHTMRMGEHRDVVTRGIKWLRAQQDAESGLIGDALGHAFLYDHALATFALTECYLFDKSPLLKRTAQLAVNYVTRARNPYGAWRYDVPPVGDNDTSITGWMVLALKSAEDAGLRVDAEAFLGAQNWLDEVTDPGTGRCGYDRIGSVSSRVDGRNEDYPTASGEAMTAVALLCRVFMGESPESNPLLARHAEVLRRVLPVWTPESRGKGNDMYYWYYGSYAMYQLGGEHWRAWSKALKPAVVGSQRQEGGAARGSWDPLGPWGWSGGRVYSTALMALCLEVEFRYGRILGAR
ncbi:MAG: prenyltransferase/squalene oxidase repeat-containing protein [Planctomycetota bacterium]